MKFKENAIKPGMVIHCPKKEDARALLEHLEKLKYDVSDIVKIYAYAIYREKTCFYINPDTGVSYGDTDFYVTVKNFRGHKGNLIITEFSDLIEPEPRFKVGDRVRIKENLMKNGVYGELAMQEDMMIWRGSEANVSEVTENGEYALKSLPYYWSAEMLELVKKSTEMSAVEVLEWLRVYDETDEAEDIFDGYSNISEILKKFTASEILQKIATYEATKKAPKPVEVERVDIVRIVEIKENGDECYVYEEKLPHNTAKRGVAEDILKKYMAGHEGNYYLVGECICQAKEDK